MNRKSIHHPKSTGNDNEHEGVFTAIRGDNSDLIARAVKLCAPAGSKIIDVTFGKGVFWRKVDLSRFDFHPSDLLTVLDHQYDFRHLPYPDESVDIEVMDPPYRHDPGGWLSTNYKNAETTRGMGHDAIIELYRDGMRDGYRVLRDGGTLWVKAQDEIQIGKQRWSHIEIHNAALELGFCPRDMLVLVQKTSPMIQNADQKHARRNHSYLWIFEKPRGGRRKGSQR